MDFSGTPNVVSTDRFMLAERAGEAKSVTKVKCHNEVASEVDNIQNEYAVRYTNQHKNNSEENKNLVRWYGHSATNATWHSEYQMMIAHWRKYPSESRYNNLKEKELCPAKNIDHRRKRPPKLI